MAKDASGKKVYGVKSAIITYLDSADKIYDDYLSYKGTDKHIDVTFFDVYTAYTEYTTPLETPELTTRTPQAQYPITHRVREIHKNADPNVKLGQGKYTFIVSGINQYSENLGSDGVTPVTINQYQVFTEKELLGRVVVGSAFLGGIFSFVSSIWGLLILLLIPAFYLIITSVIDIFKAYKEPEEATAAASNNGETTSNSGTLELSEEDKKRLKEELLEEMLNKKKGGNQL